MLVSLSSAYPHRPARKVRAVRQQPVLGQGGKSPARLPSVVPGHGVISLSFSLHWAWLLTGESSSRPWLFYPESLILIWHALRGESAECHLLIFSTGDELSTSEPRKTGALIRGIPLRVAAESSVNFFYLVGIKESCASAGGRKETFDVGLFSYTSFSSLSRNEMKIKCL